MKIPVITLYQPWATWIAIGLKTIETRKHNRFECLKNKMIAIHAGKKYDFEAYDVAERYLSSGQMDVLSRMQYPKSCIVATAYVDDFQLLNDKDHSEKALIECVTLRYGLFLKVVNNYSYDPKIFVKGHQGIWYIDL